MRYQSAADEVVDDAVYDADDVHHCSTHSRRSQLADNLDRTNMMMTMWFDTDLDYYRPVVVVIVVMVVVVVVVAKMNLRLVPLPLLSTTSRRRLRCRTCCWCG